MGKGRKIAGALLIIGAISAVSIVVLMATTGSLPDLMQNNPLIIDAQLPLKITLVDVYSGSPIDSAADKVKIYLNGIVEESLQTDASGLATGSKQFGTGQVLEIYMLPANYIPLTISYTVPKAFVTADYFTDGLSFEMYPACNGESVFLADRALAEKDAASGSAWNCTPTTPYILAYWKITLDTDDEAVGGNWWLPSKNEQYPKQHTYAIIKLSDPNGYAEGLSITGWMLSDDDVTFYKEITTLIEYDTTLGKYGVYWLEAYIHCPQSLNTNEVTLTAQIISDCDPAEMQTGNYAASSLTWEDADDAAVYIGMEA